MTDKNSSMLNKSRIEEIDLLLKEITHEVEQHNDFVCKTEMEFSLITAKVKREKVNVLAAIAKSHMLLANMDILIAESDLRSDLERLRNYQLKLKLEHDAGKTHKTSGSTKKRNKSSSSTQSSNPKKRKKSSDAPKPSTADISSDETVIIESLPQPISVENLHDCSTQIPKLDSPTVPEMISLPSFIKAEFNNPYEETDNQTHKKSDSKGKSSKHQSPVIKPKTVSEIKKSIVTSKSDHSKDSSSSYTPKSSRQKSDDRRATPSTSTYAPIRHKMPAIITQTKNYYSTPSTSTVMSPSQYKPSDNFNMFKPSDMAPNIKYFGSKQ